jgi:hypothetical protein
MAIQIEPVDDEYSRASPIRLRVGTEEAATCVEIPRAEIADTIRSLFGWLAWTDEKAASKLLKHGLFTKKPLDNAAAQARISKLEHALRHASERFGWLGQYHVHDAVALSECKKLTDECWSAQSSEDSSR